MVQKAPASSIGDLAQAIKELFHSDCEIKIIGTRHGEKQYETLLTREEYLVAEDLGDFYRIPADKRDLYYDKYFLEGSQVLSFQEEYNSNNTVRLDINQIKEKLMELDFIKKELADYKFIS